MKRDGFEGRGQGRRQESSGRHGGNPDSRRNASFKDMRKAERRGENRGDSEERSREDRRGFREQKKPNDGFRRGQGRNAEIDPAFEENPNRLEGRNAVLEAFRSGRTVDKVWLQADLHDGMIMTIAREARKAGCIISYVPKERLNQMSETGSHQGVIAIVASFDYAEVSDILKKAEEKGEDPFIFLLDGIEDPHNLGAIIRTANLAGAHGVIITKHRAVGLTATVAKASAGAINYT
ncbi:MAG: RNA methyltransferase substrate-binding domain-containing protein, partial [Eubacteriales bacterium]|nr:RNA methyltransferase substrate-binding domain-containing protein [Eubacteriales bacterium]